MFIELHDEYGEKDLFLTQSKIIPKIGDFVETPTFQGTCQKVIYFYDYDNSCQITVVVK